MKKLTRYLFILFFFAAIVPACELVDNCKTCKLITIEDGKRTEGHGILSCGKELEEKENSSPVTIGNKTTFWECK